MAAVMSADMDNTDKIVTLVDECERMDRFIPPDVNKGLLNLPSMSIAALFGPSIGAIKGVG